MTIKTLVGVALLLQTGLAFADSPTIPVSATYDDIVAFTQKVAHDYPQNTQLFTLGHSDSGKDIIGIKIGSGPVHNVLVSTHHGNEYGATEVGKAFMLSVAQNPIANQTMYVIPVLNIGGYNDRNREEIGSDQNSHDPNRDYPGPCGTDGPFKLQDTEAMANFIDQENIVVSSTLHTFTPAVAYPWGISTQDLDTGYTDIFQMLTQAATVESQYQTGNSTTVIYPADGCYEDYAFWKHGIWSILFELGDTHTPSDDQVAQLEAVNVPGLRRMYEKAPTARAEKHDFTGKCDTGMMHLDLHIE